eukprot:2450228-Rhodomonas_salina.1
MLPGNPCPPPTPHTTQGRQRTPSAPQTDRLLLARRQEQKHRQEQQQQQQQHNSSKNNKKTTTTTTTPSARSKERERATWFAGMAYWPGMPAGIRIPCPIAPAPKPASPPADKSWGKSWKKGRGQGWRGQGKGG